MKVDGKWYKSLWFDPEIPDRVFVIDQDRLPFSFWIAELLTLDDVFHAIRDMMVRGAPVIGAAAAWGLYLAARKGDAGKHLFDHIKEAAGVLADARPTAVNLKYALTRQIQRIHRDMSHTEIVEQLKAGAQQLVTGEEEACRRIGVNGLPLIREIAEKKNGQPVNILTHCNAGWLACIDWGTALAPVYMAAGEGVPVHVWVDETRPRNQGARLTLWELQKAGIPCTLVVDNTGGHLMQHGMVDLVLVGSDRTTRSGDTANKIGTYLKALAAWDNNIPFYVALPASSFDLSVSDGIAEIPIELRNSEEVLFYRGDHEGKEMMINIAPKNARAVNYAFDVTPARLITKLITDVGICNAAEEEITGMIKNP